MVKNILLLLACLVFISCAPALDEVDATLIPTFISTETATPAPTYTPSPIPTLTQTSIPTPFGGGDGVLILSSSPILKNGILSEPGELYQVNSDGTGLRQILSSAQIKTFAGENYEWVIYTADNENNYLITKKNLYVVTDDWRVMKQAGLKYSRSINSISDWEHILWKDLSEYYYLTNAETGTQITIGPHQVIGFSADKNIVYYYDPQLGSFHAKNSDGSVLRNFSLDALQSLTNAGSPFGFFEWEVALAFGSFEDRPDAKIAISPDQSKAAFAWDNSIVIADATDVEFNNPELLAVLPNSIYSLIWSPDGKTLLAGMIRCDDFTCGSSPDFIVLDAISGEVKTNYTHEIPFLNMHVCGFSPDSKKVVLQMLYLEYRLRILDLEDLSYIDIEFNARNCPFWR